MHVSPNTQRDFAPEPRDGNGNAHTQQGQPQLDPAEAKRRAQRFLRVLCRQVVQSETAVRLHCTHEADRLGQLPPAAPMRAAAAHAEQALKGLPGQGTAEQLPMSVAGTLAGTVLSAVQEAIVERLISSEQAYRTTLLGLREGVDLVRMLKELARLQAEPALETWCGDWLEARLPLVLDAEGGLTWFAQHSDVATQIARPFMPQRRA